MLDLNDPLLSAQTKRGLLAQDLDKDHQRRTKKYSEEAEGPTCSFPSFWVIPMRDFVGLNYHKKCSTCSGKNRLKNLLPLNMDLF